MLKQLEPLPLAKVKQNVVTLIQQRDRLISALEGLNVVRKIWPSEANFILLQCSLNVVQRCQDKGIVLRNMDKRLGLENVVRISVGTPEENDKLLSCLRML